MRKYLFLLSAIMLCCQTLAAAGCRNPCRGWPSESGSCTRWPSAFNVNFGGGFRKDRFEWNIAGFHNHPKVLSQLTWKDLRIAQIGGDATYVSCRNYAIKVAAQFGHIYHGYVTDADYACDHKKGLFSLSRNKAAKGHVYDLSTAAGYRVISTNGRFTAIPLVGYSQYGQYLHLYDGHQLFPFDYHFTGLNSRYTTRWFGPWIGIDFEAQVERCAYLFGGFEWHMLAYRGHGKWNLRNDIGPFNHKAYGMGYVISLGGKWEIWNNWAIGFEGFYRNFRTRHGHEHLTVYDPVFGPIQVGTRFNQAKWQTYSISAIIAWRF